nr:hypothetical protein [Photobacterium leiognathi]
MGLHFTVSVMPSMGQIGSGALPTEQLESVALCFGVSNNQTSHTLNDLADLLASGEIPIIGRIHHNRLWLCLRGISHEQDFIAQLAHLSLTRNE